MARRASQQKEAQNEDLSPEKTGAELLRDELGRLVKGVVLNPKGRPKGTPNKINGDVKAMVMKSLEMVGGEEYLAFQAFNNPAAYMALLGKTLPKTMSLELHVASKELIEKLNERRQQLVELQTIDGTATEVTKNVKRRTRS